MVGNSEVGCEYAPFDQPLGHGKALEFKAGRAKNSDVGVCARVLTVLTDRCGWLEPLRNFRGQRAEKSKVL